MVKVDERSAFMSALRDLHPDPKSELHFTTPFELLVAVMLSAQATDKGVNLVTAKLFPVANTPEAIVELGLDELTGYVRSLNLFKTKARHVYEMSQILLERWGGRVPQDFDALTSLPGVGRKTANVVLNVAFGEPRIAVDTHIFRVCNRTKFASGKTPDEVEKKLLKIVPKEFLPNAHHWLLLFGRYVCKARNPDCTHCPVSAWCSAPEKKAALARAADEGRKTPRRTRTDAPAS